MADTAAAYAGVFVDDVMGITHIITVPYVDVGAIAQFIVGELLIVVAVTKIIDPDQSVKGVVSVGISRRSAAMIKRLAGNIAVFVMAVGDIHRRGGVAITESRNSGIPAIIIVISATYQYARVRVPDDIGFITGELGAHQLIAGKTAKVKLK